MLTSSNGNMFCVTGFCAGNSPVTGEFPSHRPVARGFDVFVALCLNKRLSKQSRRRWFETPSRSSWPHCNVVPNSDPVIRTAMGSFDVQRVTHVQFLIGETAQIGGFRTLWKEWPHIWHTALPWLPFLEIDYIFGEEINEIYVLFKNEWPACYAYYQYHPQCLLYSRDGRKRRRSWQQSYSLYASAVSKWCNHRQGHNSFAIITSYGNQITPAKHEDNPEIKV